MTTRADQSVSLGWNPSPDTNVTGYILHYGGKSGTYTTSLDIGTNLSASVPGLKEGATNYFAVTSYNALRIESDPSNEVRYFVPGVVRLTKGKSGNLPELMFPVAPGRSYEVQATTDFVTWDSIYQTTATTNGWVDWMDTSASSHPRRFYRIHTIPKAFNSSQITAQ